MNKLRTLVGIPVRENPAATARTVASLREGAPDLPIVLMGDGVDEHTRLVLERMGANRSTRWERTLGNAACFNRLVQGEEADLYVLLENGALVAPGWLDRIEQALAAHSSHGIAGPSTNQAWNEQCAFPELRPDAASLARASQDAAARFGAAHAELRPLHSLGDFCYAVTKSVVQAIGAADEGYGDGPCWEMDYNIRAARGGFAGLWVKAAVVWRADQGNSRRAIEARRFLINKRRYQDHFCGLRLDSTSRSYDEHCTGEACPHFAPPGQVVLRREFAAAPAAMPQALPPPAHVPPSESLDAPRVSCIMPTADRRPYVGQAIAAFLAQDYGNRELVIVDDGVDSIEDLVPTDERIQYVRRPRGQSLGAKRNEACRLASGEIIVHWDDDDWHAAWRLSYQVGALLSEQADICGLNRLWFFDPDNRRGWQYVYQGRPRWLAGGSFCYRKSVWERHPFADVGVGEDTRFVREAPFRKIFALARDDFYVARIHSRNTCRKQTGGSCWRQVSADTVHAIIDAASPPPADRPADMHGSLGPNVCIGVHARCDAARLEATLRHLIAHTPPAVQVRLLIDGADPDLRAVLPRYSHLDVSATDEALGAPACFNRLLRESDAEVYVFLESGSLVGPGWLAHLLSALAAGEKHGLAGPTTNMAWSIQGECRDRGARPENIDQIARELALSKAGRWQDLAPLHCLADFCYAVRRDVAQRIGGADEAYGHGPCWEMDYTVRALRAGFASVWARAAYVYRMPFTAERNRDEAMLLPASKARYQSKFCGLILDGARTAVADRCRGDQCEHFAPAQTIRIPHAFAERLALASAPARPSATARPLVTCIMPTGGRLEWVRQSIRYFQRQDYPNLELVVVDDGPQSVADLLPCEPRIRYLHCPRPLSIGAKRNRACELAQGEVIVHWDDDDWYGRSRISMQVAPLLEGEFDITAFEGTPFFDVSAWQFWNCTPSLFAHMFRYAVHGGTLAFRRSLLAKARYPDVSLAEDAEFMEQAIQRGARLKPQASAEHFIYVRHGRNAWRFTCGRHRDAAGWTRLDPPGFAQHDLQFYEHLRTTLQEA